MARAQRLIKTTPEVAFTYLSDVTRHGEWAVNPGVKLQQTSPGAVMIGATFRSRGRQFGITMEDEVTVTEFRPPERFAFESEGKSGVYRHSFDFEVSDGGTLVTKEMRALESPRAMRLLKPLAEIVLSRRLAGDLKRIAERLEVAG